MILYFLRHGRAARFDAKDLDDQNNSLSEEGAKVLEKIAALAGKTLGSKPDVIISSPYKRAIQSAEIAKRILGPKDGKIIVHDSLSPDSTPYDFYGFISKQNFDAETQILLVSHKPFIIQIISDLIGSDPNIRFLPGSMARVDLIREISSRNGVLVWLMPSDLLS